MPLDPSHVYEEAGRSLRYYLDWRARILAGYFATLAALALTFAWLTQHGHNTTASWVPMLGAALTIVFWLLDYRNRDLYRASMDTAADLERTASIAAGVHDRLQRTARTTLVLHSTVLDYLFATCALISFLLGTYLLAGNPLP